MQNLTLKTDVVNRGHFHIAVSSILGMQAKGRDRTLIELKNGTKHRGKKNVVVDGKRQVLVHGDVKNLKKRWMKLKELQRNHGEGETPQERTMDTKQQVERQAQGFTTRSAATPFGPGHKVGHPGTVLTKAQKQENERLYRLAKRQRAGTEVSPVAARLGAFLRRREGGALKVAEVDTRTEQRTHMTDTQHTALALAALKGTKVEPVPERTQDELEADFNEQRYVDWPEKVAPVCTETEPKPAPEVDHDDAWLDALMNEDWQKAHDVVNAVLKRTGTWQAKRAQLKDARAKRDALSSRISEMQEQLGRITELVETLEDDMKDMSDNDIAKWEKRGKIADAGLSL